MRSVAVSRSRLLRRLSMVCVSVLAAALVAAPVTAKPAAADTGPTAVAVAADFDSTLGCGSDWAPDCPQAQMTPRGNDGVWSLTATLPAGSYNYKAALNGSWTVNYGLHAEEGGPNIPLSVPAGGATVTFLYDPVTHWITDTINDPIATAAGDFQHALGCPSDWSPDCLRSWLEDPDGDGTYTFTTTAIPAGDYQVKVALGMSWTVNYGADGVPGGANIPFTVGRSGAPTTFSYNAASHLLTVFAGKPGPSLVKRQAYWLTPDTIAWKPGTDAADQTYEMAAAFDGGLGVGSGELTGGTVIPLSRDPAGLPAALTAKYPYLASYDVLHLPAQWAQQARALLRGQVAVAAIDGSGDITEATGLQIAGVLDSLYATSAAAARLGPVFRSGRPTLQVWAPTAHQVSLELYDSSTAADARLIPMNYDAATGVWSVTGDPDWDGKFYLYRVSVWAPSTMSVVTNHVTDPYSLALSADSTRSEIVDLNDPALTPPGWGRTPSPKPLPMPEQEVQELHIRDFSFSDTTVPANERGTYLAFTDPGSAGMKHLRALARAGATAVQIMPAFDFAGVPEIRADQATPPCDLSSYPPDSDRQQACIARTQATDGYNWGYNPFHFTVPEGSYATDPNGAARTLQFRDMVAALHRMGLRVVLDVVYNHTAAAGESPDSVLDQIVPGYYQRLDAGGAVTTDSCCSDTAPENAMMNKLVVDSVTTWAKEYHIDGFRFDLMGLDPKQTMLDVKSALAKLTVARDGIDGAAELLYGEGWNFGVVADNARFVQATQANMAGTGIGTFNDRLRDAVRGGSPFDTDPRIQGFGSGQYTDSNGDPVNGTAGRQKATLMHDTDLVELGLAGNLSDYRFTDSEGNTVTGSGLDYNGAPAGYTAAPGESVNYVDVHDNLDLFDALTYKLPTSTPMADRARVQALALATTTLSQGPGFAQAGTDLLRSKSLDGNSYDSGDWFNDIHWDCTTGNGFGRGLPMASSNKAQWPYAAPLLADTGLVPGCDAMTSATRQFQELLRIKRSTPLFSLPTAAAVRHRLSFPLSGTDGQVPGVITEHLDGTGLKTYASATVIFNATPKTAYQVMPSLIGTQQELHPAQRSGNDPVVEQSRFTGATGTFTVPAFTVAVFVQREH